MIKTYVRTTGPDAPVGIGGVNTVKDTEFSVDESCVTEQIKAEFSIVEAPVKKFLRKGA